MLWRGLNAIEQQETLLYIALHLQHQRQYEKTMATAKTSTLTFRIEPNLKEALCAAAEHDHRSIANMVAVMIREHCDRVGIPIQAMPQELVPEAVKTKPRKR